MVSSYFKSTLQEGEFELNIRLFVYKFMQN
jgi:hypothetical protein